MVSISVYAVEARPSSGAFRDNSQAYFMRDQFLYDFSSDPQVPFASIDKQDVWHEPLPFRDVAKPTSQCLPQCPIIITRYCLFDIEATVLGCVRPVPVEDNA